MSRPFFVQPQLADLAFQAREELADLAVDDWPRQRIVEQGKWPTEVAGGGIGEHRAGTTVGREVDGEGAADRVAIADDLEVIGDAVLSNLHRAGVWPLDRTNAGDRSRDGVLALPGDALDTGYSVLEHIGVMQCIPNCLRRGFERMRSSEFHECAILLCQRYATVLV